VVQAAAAHRRARRLLLEHPIKVGQGELVYLLHLLMQAAAVAALTPLAVIILSQLQVVLAEMALHLL
jgi:hypothetical protein